MERKNKMMTRGRFEGKGLTCGSNVIKEWWRGEAIQEEGGLGGGHRRGGGRGGATWEREGKSNTLGFHIIAFSFLFSKEYPKGFLLQLDGFTNTAGVDTQVRCIQRESYHLMRDPPAGLAALLLLKLA